MPSKRTCLSQAIRLLASGVVMLQYGTAQAEAAPPSAKVGLEEIIVTAQKRSQSINDVGMSINAFTGDTLAERGITSMEGLEEIVPGFTTAISSAGEPIYTLRGVGVDETTLAASPAVTVYIDEIPLPYTIMTAGTMFDLERVEVLKGPQGTLFGQNSTGGAINYIANKPTDEFESGIDLSYERFGKNDISGFVSGPLSETVNARLALRTVQGGAWQKSTSREDELGDKNLLMGRFLLEWEASDKLMVNVNLNGFKDESDTLAGQLIGFEINNPNAVLPELLTQPFVDDDARAADWSPDRPSRRDNKFLQASVRLDYELSEAMTLTSQTSYSDMTVHSWVDTDATQFDILNSTLNGDLEVFNQEVRLAGDTDRVSWVAGLNYSHEETLDIYEFSISQNSLGVVPGLEFLPRLRDTDGSLEKDADSYGVFGNIEYGLTENLKVQAGARYTDTKQDGLNCAQGGDEAATLFNVLQLLGSPNPVTLVAGDCHPLDETFTSIKEPLDNPLDEDNTAWRVGLTYDFDTGALGYLTFSRGYKSGIIPTITPSASKDFAPVTQEKVDVIELGFKAPMLDNRLQLNGAIFHYDYVDKQLRGTILDANFGLLVTMVNVPESKIQGAELELIAQPVDGLSLSLNGTYIDSEVTDTFEVYNKQLQFADFDGSELPYTPKSQINGSIQYEWPVSGNGLMAFVGGSFSYADDSNATFATSGASADEFVIDSYTLLNLQAGLAAEDGKWRATLFGRNVTDEYRWSSVYHGSDTTFRSAGMPAVYGVSLSLRM